MPIPLAVTPGAWIFITIIIVLVLAVAVTSYGRGQRGTGISEHPIDDRAAAPGAGGPTENESTDEELPGNAGTR